MADLTNFPVELFVRFSHKMPLYIFYTVMQKSQNLPKSQIKGGGGGDTALRPAGGVNHPDSVLAKVFKLPAKRALR